MEPEPTLKEFYNGYEPPRYALKDVQTLLRSVPEMYLRRLDCVILTNQSGLPRRDRLGKTTSRKRKVPQSRILGRYHPAWQGKKAWIELFIDKIEPEIRKHAWLPIARYGVFALVLFHEIGHHIHAEIAPEHEEREDVAENWRRKLLRIFLRKRYWYLYPIRKPIGVLLKAYTTRM